MSVDLVKRLRRSWDSDRSIMSQTSAWMVERREAADRIEQLERMVLDCEKYLKPGETPRQRMDRDHADVLALMKLLEIEKRRSEGFEDDE